MPRSARSSSRSRYDSPYRRYQRTAIRMTSGGNRKPANPEPGCWTGGRGRRRFIWPAWSTWSLRTNRTAPRKGCAQCNSAEWSTWETVTSTQPRETATPTFRAVADNKAARNGFAPTSPKSSAPQPKTCRRRGSILASTQGNTAMIKGEGTTVAEGVTPDEAFDFVLDPAQYTKADTKMVWVTKLADTPDGMLAREDGKFLGRFPGSVVTRYRWVRPHSIDVTLEHGVPRRLHAWFEIDAVEGGTRIRHVEELDLGHGPLGWLHDLVAAKWFARSVDAEVAEIGRLLESGERGRGVAGAHERGAAEERDG